MDDPAELAAPGGEPRGSSPWRAPGQEPPQRAERPVQAQQGWQQPSPHQAPPAWHQQAPQPTFQPLPQPQPQQPPVVPWLAEPQGNPDAVWSWVVALPCAPLGLVLGVLGLLRARRRAGAGTAHAAVGTALSVVVLLVGTAGLVVGAVAGLAALTGGMDGSRPPDGTVASFSDSEQAFIDDLYEDTYQSFDDSTLLDMAYGFCSDMDAGESPPEADAALVERWASEQLDLDAAYDVEHSATATLCQQHAEEFQDWDPSSTDGTEDGPGGTTSTTTTTTSAPVTAGGRRS